MATFGSFAGLAAGAMGALSSSELQLLNLCDLPSQKSSTQAFNNDASPRQQQESNHSSYFVAQRSGFLSRLSVENLAPEYNGIGCFETVFGWQNS